MLVDAILLDQTPLLADIFTGIAGPQGIPGEGALSLTPKVEALEDERPLSNLSLISAYQGSAETLTVRGRVSAGDGGSGVLRYVGQNIADADATAANGRSYSFVPDGGEVNLLAFGGGELSGVPTHTAIEAAAATGASVIRLDRKVTLTAKATLLRGVTFRGGHYHSTISNGDYGIDIAGVKGTDISLLADVTFGAEIIPVATAGLEINQWVYLRDSKVFVGSCYNGEWVQVAEIINATSFRANAELRSQYETSQGAFIEPWTTLDGVGFEGVTFSGLGADPAANDYLDNQNFVRLNGATPRLDDVKVMNGSIRGFRFERCPTATVNNSQAFRMTREGFSYPFAFSEGTSNVTFTDNFGADIRHLISFGGDKGPNRYIICTGNRGSAYDALIDCHPETEGGYFAQNTIRSRLGNSANDAGMTLQGANLTAESNIIQGAQGVAILFQPNVNKNVLPDGRNLLMANDNQIDRCGGSGIFFDLGPTMTDNAFVDARSRDNSITKCGGSGVYAYAQNNSFYAFSSRGDTIVDCEGDSGDGGVYMRSSSGQKFRTAEIIDFKAASKSVAAGIRTLANIDDLTVDGAKIDGRNEDGTGTNISDGIRLGSGVKRGRIDNVEAYGIIDKPIDLNGASKYDPATGLGVLVGGGNKSDKDYGGIGYDYALNTINIYAGQGLLASVSESALNLNQNQVIQINGVEVLSAAALRVTTEIRVGGVKVLGPQQPAIASTAAITPYIAPTVSDPPAATEMQALADRVAGLTQETESLRAQVEALTVAARTHGWIAA